MLPSEQLQVSWDSWQGQLELTDAADAALATAEKALTALRATHEDRLHLLPEIDALVGLGHAARQADRFEDAAASYEAAMEFAAAAHYRFGLVRALVSVGYLTLLSGPAQHAADTFQRAGDLARELDERVYLAAALTGLGDALVRLHEDDDAERRWSRRSGCVSSFGRTSASLTRHSRLVTFTGAVSGWTRRKLS